MAPKQSRVGTAPTISVGGDACALRALAQCVTWGRLASVIENVVKNGAFRAPTGRVVESCGRDVIGQDKNDQDGDNEGIKCF